jgi:type IV pilus assembly protein PilN
MYSLDINFLKDRQLGGSSDRGGGKVAKKPMELGASTPIIAGGAVLAILPSLALGAWWLINAQKAKLDNEINTIKAELGDPQANSQKIQSLQQELDRATQETKALVDVFNQIKPWSAVLEDIRNQTPTGVQINSIEQNQGAGGANAPTPSGNLLVKGFAQSYKDVNNFFLTLQRSDFIDASKTKLEKATLTDNPTTLDLGALPEGQNISVELPKVIEYSMNAAFNNKPATQLLRELERNSALGLVTRIKTIEQKGLNKL